jgi:uncharacterized membrane protein YbhN (UPF0104 family)
MRGKLRRFLPIIKWLIVVILLAGIGYTFWTDLQNPKLWQRSLRQPAWLPLSGMLYIFGIGFSALYWQRLLGRFGQTASIPAAARAYYVGHLGKYVPGKAWALLLRVSLIRPAGVPAGLATLTTFYEVLVTMASGVLLAVVLFALFAPATPSGVDIGIVSRIAWREDQTSGFIDRNTSVVLSLLVLAPVLGPILPPIFNRLVHHISMPFREKDTPAPALSWSAFIEGLAVTGCGWPLLGVSLAVVLYVGPLGDLSWDAIPLGFVFRLVAIMAVAYVSGFVIPIPGGIGVREFVIRLFLTPELVQLLNLQDAEARQIADQTAIILRLVMTVAELLMAAVVYWLRPTQTDT